MKPIKDEEERRERIEAVRRQLGSPRLFPQKRRDLTKYLNRLMYAKVSNDS